ncbi:MAG: arginine N-succinyltransferase [Bdellovibrionaceae bacterium]|nr:arginine N-succinyltransferase [Pseudobdellovibrionaceae bacterium]
MNFLLRNVAIQDLKQLSDLAGQFSLLNLPSDKKVLAEKIERSQGSFSGDLAPPEAEYLFVVEDLEQGQIAGSSLIIAKHGNEESPHYYFKILKKNRFSEDLGIGFIHQVLRLCEDTDGPTEIGGLLIDRNYRRRPEKLGRQISLIRFLFMGMNPEDFQSRVLCELTPPLAEGGRSEFWEALGRRFTGLPYQEADLISQRNKEFISSLFPEEEIYLTLLDSRARLVLGRVGQETRPAQHLLESIGFQYLHEVDPFDGGPHYGADTQDISIVKNGRWVSVLNSSRGQFSQHALIGVHRDGQFRGVQSAFEDQDGQIVLPESAMRTLSLDPGEKVYISPVKGG